jgi:DNA-binding transcriptional MerR regulator
MPTLYPIRAVAKITGISVETLRAWERRYQVVEPDRSGRGRQYSAADIERLGRLNRLVQQGHAIGGIATLPDSELDALLDEPVALTSGAGFAPQGVALGPVLTAIEQFDAARAGDELGRLAAILAPRDFVHDAVVPLMREVGTRWHDGRFAIAQEHLVSQVLRNLLGGMLRLFRPAAPTRRMVVATPARESHEFGILAAAMLASMAGIEPVYLGVDLPADEIARTSRLVSAHVVLLGLTVNTGTTESEVRTLATSIPASTQLWVGGAGAAHLDLPGMGRPVMAFPDLQAFELECRRWRS